MKLLSSPKKTKELHDFLVEGGTGWKSGLHCPLSPPPLGIDIL